MVEMGNNAIRQAGQVAARARVGALEVDLEKFVADFAARSPRAGDGYTLPTKAERATLVRAWELLRGGDADRAAQLVAPLGMDVARLVDTGAAQGAESLVMYDRGVRGDSRGIGMYLARAGASSEDAFHLQSPHPWDDNHTERISALAYRSSDATTLALAGASRKTGRELESDAAHSPDSAFTAIAETISTPGSRIVQLHGFGQSRHPGYGAAVVSTGGDHPDDLSRAVTSALRDRYVDARLVGVDGSYPNLAGRNNVQGAHARSNGASWVHVELGDKVRDAAAERVHVAEAMVDAARSTAPS